MKIILPFLMILFISTPVFGKSKAKFYDFSDQMINGEIKKPAAIYMESRTRAKFVKLLKLKKSFRKILILSYHDPLLK
jgi:hypothetical protein